MSRKRKKRRNSPNKNFTQTSSKKSTKKNKNTMVMAGNSIFKSQKATDMEIKVMLEVVENNTKKTYIEGSKEDKTEIIDGIYETFGINLTEEELDTVLDIKVDDLTAVFNNIT